MRTWTLLLTGPANGLVGHRDEPFDGSPANYERVKVVDASEVDDYADRIDGAISHLLLAFPDLTGADAGIAKEALYAIDHALAGLRGIEAGQA